jgi:hypothetical protein
MRVEICINYLFSFATRYCIFIRRDPVQYYYDVSTQFLKGFLSWVCDQRRRKGGRRQSDIKHTTSLETFWKWYLMVYKLEAGQKIDNMIMAPGQDVGHPPMRYQIES